MLISFLSIEEEIFRSSLFFDSCGHALLICNNDDDEEKKMFVRNCAE
jgi:hypothetical protein